MTTPLELIAAERERQIEEEGYTPEHDDKHVDGELASASACYAAGRDIFYGDDDPIITSAVELWPWEGNVEDALAGKPRIRQLVIAGALIAAEIERLQRAEIRATNAGQSQQSGGTPCRDSNE